MVHLFRFTAEKATVDLGKVPYHFKQETSIAFKMTNTEAFPGAAAGFRIRDGLCCGVGLLPGPGTSACCAWDGGGGGNYKSSVMSIVTREEKTWPVN